MLETAAMKLSGTGLLAATSWTDRDQVSPTRVHFTELQVR